MKIIGDTIIYNADDEEPDCMRCDRLENCDGHCCGAQYGWKNYIRYGHKNDLIAKDGSKLCTE